MPTDFVFVAIALLLSHVAMFGLGYGHGRSVWRRGLPPSTRKAIDRERKRGLRVVSLTPEARNRLSIRTVQTIRSIESDDEPTDVGPKPGSTA